MAVAAAVAILATSAGAASTNLLTNGTFEGTGSGSLTGWKGQNASLVLVPGDGGGFAAQVTRTAKDNYAILTAAKTVSTATAGTTYSADGRFMAAVGKSICLKLKETGAATTSTMSCAPGTGAWATIPEVSYTAAHDRRRPELPRAPAARRGRRPLRRRQPERHAGSRCHPAAGVAPRGRPLEHRDRSGLDGELRGGRLSRVPRQRHDSDRNGRRPGHDVRGHRARPLVDARLHGDGVRRVAGVRPVQPGRHDDAGRRCVGLDRGRGRHRVQPGRPQLQRRRGPERLLPAGGHGQPHRPGLIRPRAGARRRAVRLRLARRVQHEL